VTSIDLIVYIHIDCHTQWASFPITRDHPITAIANANFAFVLSKITDYFHPVNR
jgi:hypothetical protein